MAIDENHVDADALLKHVESEMRMSERYPAPGDDAFDDGAEFTEAFDLEEMANELIERYPQFAWLANQRVLYRWKRTGPASKGKCTSGKLRKISGELKHETRANYYLWLAANHVRDLEMTRFQVQALLAHELCHADLDEKGNPSTADHDVEEFDFVVAHWGLWQRGLQNFYGAAQQMSFEDVR